MIQLIYKTENHKLVGPREHILLTQLDPAFIPRKGDMILIDDTQHSVQRIIVEYTGKAELAHAADPTITVWLS